MNRTLLGNIICFSGSLIMVAVGFFKEKKRILTSQCLQFLIMGAGNLVLGGISGAISDFIGIVRNIISLKINFNWIFKIIFIGLQIALTVIFNDSGLIGWLPVFATCIFTWCLDTKNEILLKLLIILAQIMWGIYDLSFKNYSTMGFDIATILSNTVGIFMICKNKKKYQKENCNVQEKTLPSE